MPRYFFLSHVQTRDGQGLIAELFEDIATRVRVAVGAGRDQPVGCLRRSDRLADVAADEAMACPVLVPLYSERYFRSGAAGRIVSAFQSRADGGRPLPILPLLWTPVSRSWPPVRALPIEVDGLEANDTHCLLEAMAARGDREADDWYDAVLDELTRRIVALAAGAPRRLVPVDPMTLPNAFTRPANALRMDLHLLAPNRSRMPAGREPDSYGSSALHWDPYPQGGPGGIGRPARSMAEHLGYQPTFVAADAAELVLPGYPPTGPALLFIDPWALDDDRWRDQLSEFDKQERPWVSILVAWNPDDRQTAQNQDRLRKQLYGTLPTRFGRRRPGLELEAGIAGSLEDVGRALPALLQEATHRYLRWKGQQP